MNIVEIEALLAREAPLFLPAGTIEAHGRHLPVGTDTICAEKIAEELSINLQGAVAPSIEYGITSTLAQTSPASFFPEELYEKFFEQIVENFYNHGFKTIVIINGHSGNRDPIKRLVKRCVRQHPIAISVINWWLLSEKYVEPIFNTRPGGHAAVEETALMLHFCPTMVDPDNYSPSSDDYVPEDGIWLYPPPGEVLLSQKGQGQPVFDCGKSADFVKALIEELTDRIQHWLNTIKRLQGGLRP
jgi:creatinine amidohydrolase